MQSDTNIIAVTKANSSKKSYRHISDNEVSEIFGEMWQIQNDGFQKAKKISDLAKRHNCSRATIYRLYNQAKIELNHDCSKKPKIEYQLDALLNKRRKNRETCSRNSYKFDKAKVFISLVIEFMKQDPKLRSPEVAIATLLQKKIDYGFKTLYTYIEEFKTPDFKPCNLLRQAKWKKHKKNDKEYTKRETRGTSIEERPEEINSRTVFGHWEGDLVTGPRDGKNGAYLTLVERVTRMYLTIPVPNKESKSIYTALEAQSKRFGNKFNMMFKSITFDNGNEFALWRDMEDNLGLKIYFGRPYHACDRGSNENANGLIRRFIKKGTDIGKISKEYTRDINRRINRMKRKIFGFKSAEYMFFEELKKLGITINDIYDY